MKSKNKLKKYVLLLLVGLILFNVATAEEFDYQNQTFEITPLIEEICNENQTTVFHIKRLNYSSGDDAVNLEYEQTLIYNESILIQKSIEKEIKSYTKANTGLVYFENNGMHKLTFETKNISLGWEYNISICEENSTVNASINNTTNQTTNITTNETPAEEDYSDFNVNTDKNLYEEGEKVKIFFNNVNIQNYSITYWIEDLKGKIVKNSYTTENTNTKSFTPKVEEFEKTFILKAYLNVANQSIYSKKVFTSYDPSYTEQEDIVEEKNEITIEKIEYVKNKLFFEVNIEKNFGRKRIVKIWAESFDGDKISEEFKLDVKKGKFKFYGNLELENKEDVFLIVEGLDFSKREYLEIEFSERKDEKLKLISAKTQKKYLDSDMMWSVKVDGEGDGFLVVDLENNSLQIINFTNTNEKTYTFKLNASQENRIKTYLLQKNEYQMKEDIVLLEDKSAKTKIPALNQNEEKIDSIIMQEKNSITGKVTAEEIDKKVSWVPLIAFLGLLGGILMYLKRDRLSSHFDRFIKKYL